MKRVLLILAVLLILVFAGWKWLASKGGETVKVSIEKAEKRSIIESVSASGKIYPENQARISPDFSGQVTELNVSEGDYVKKGQVLARINNRSAIEAPISGTIISLNIKKGESVTGNTFTMGTEMMTVADMNQLELRVDVAENDIVKINVGDTADVEVDAYDNRKFRGAVTRIANSSKNASPGFGVSNDATSYEVRIRLDTASYRDLAGKTVPFRPGMNASADIRTKKAEDVLAVPISAVNARVKGSDKNREEKKKEEQADREENGTGMSGSDPNEELEEVVFVLKKDGTVQKNVVKSGIQDINYIEIKNGLNAGDEVVTGPYNVINSKLKTGMKVKVVARDKLFEK